MWMSSIKALPSNNSSPDFGWKLVDRNYQSLWPEDELSQSSLDITYECEKHGGKYWMLLLLFFDCLFLLHFWHDICINRCLNGYWNQYALFSIGSLCYLGMTEDGEWCDKMSNEVDDSERDIRDDDYDGLQSNSWKE